MVEYPFPVWGTQGGGLVKQLGDRYIFVEEPNCPGLRVGDAMPAEWGLAAANKSASQVEEDFFDGFCESADLDFQG